MHRRRFTTPCRRPLVSRGFPPMPSTSSGPTRSCIWMWINSRTRSQRTGKTDCDRSWWLPARERSTPAWSIRWRTCARVAREQEIWFHVDGAYGGFFQLTDRGREALRGIEQADSITLDPHKGLFLPYGTGCLLARDGNLLKAAHEVHADYLPAQSEDPGLPDFSSYSPELTRDFRGLRLWLPLHLHGTDSFVSALDEKLDLAALCGRGAATASSSRNL